MTDPHPYGESWYAATKVAAPERPRLTFDLDVDLCVIGGGLAGLTTAREVARRGWSVALLEARQVAWNASGRNDGFVLPGFMEGIEQIAARVGRDHAKALWELSETGVRYVRDAVAETAMPGVDPVDGWLSVSKTDDRDAQARLLSLLGGEFGANVEGWPTERVRAVLKSKSYFNALYFPAALQIHALNYALGLAAAAERAGVRIFEQTPALTIDPAGVRKRVVTPSARVRAGHVVLAGNTHLGGLLPRLGQTVLPISTYVITTAPLGDRLGEAIATAAAVSDGARADNHYRIVDGSRLMWSGRATTWQGNPRRYANALHADIRRAYPQLKGVQVDYAWSGTLGRSVHKMPQIGELSPGLWVASAFGGHGLNTTAMAGCLLARAITESDQTWRLFSPYELVWAGGVLGRAAAQIFYWSHRAGERAGAALAQRREKTRGRRRPWQRRNPPTDGAPALAPEHRSPLPEPVHPDEAEHVAMSDADMAATPHLDEPRPADALMRGRKSGSKRPLAGKQRRRPADDERGGAGAGQAPTTAERE